MIFGCDGYVLLYPTKIAPPRVAVLLHIVLFIRVAELATKPPVNNPPPHVPPELFVILLLINLGPPVNGSSGFQVAIPAPLHGELLIALLNPT